MKWLTNRSGAAVLVGIVLGAAAAGGAWSSSASATGSEARMAPPSAVIAIVDLDAVLRGLTEADLRQQELKALESRLRDEIDALKQQIDSEKSRLDAASSPLDKENIERRIQKLRIQHDIEVTYSNATMTKNETKMLADLYDKICAGAADLAKRSGYTMVLTSDEGLQVPRDKPDEFMRAVMLRRMLYVDDAHDITQELITFMNNRTP